MSITSTAATAVATVAHETAAGINVAGKSGATVVDNAAAVLDDIGQDTTHFANQAANEVVSDVTHALASPGWIARTFQKGAAKTHLSTVAALPKEALSVVRTEADELVLHGPQGAVLTFKRDNGVIKLSTRYGEGFKLAGRDGMTVNPEQLPENIAQLMDEAGFLTKAGQPIPVTAEASSVATAGHQGNEHSGSAVVGDAPNATVTDAVPGPT